MPSARCSVKTGPGEGVGVMEGVARALGVREVEAPMDSEGVGDAVRDVVCVGERVRCGGVPVTERVGVPVGLAVAVPVAVPVAVAEAVGVAAGLGVPEKDADAEAGGVAERRWPTLLAGGVAQGIRGVQSIGKFGKGDRADRSGLGVRGYRRGRVVDEHRGVEQHPLMSSAHSASPQASRSLSSTEASR
jgi:hypothetical protein